MRDLTKLILLLLGGMAFISTISFGANYANCAWYGYQTGRSTRYAPLVGCMVDVGTHWTPRAELRTEQ